MDCTNLDLLEVQSDISNTSSIYSIMSVDDMEEETSSADYSLINSLANPEEELTKYGYASKYGITMPHTVLTQEWDEFVQEYMDQPTERNCMNLDQPYLLGQQGQNKLPLQCTHEWLLKEGTTHAPCFSCGFYPSLTKRGTCKHCRKQICNTCLQTDYQILIPELPKHNNTPTRTQLLEARISVLESRLNILETQFQQQQTCTPQPEFVQHTHHPELPSTSTPLPFLSDQNMVFIKTPSICNTSRAIDLRVQCRLNIQGHHLDIQALIDTGATSSTVDEDILMTFLPQYLLKYTNSPQISTLFDGSKQAIHKFVHNAHLKFYTNCGTYSEALPISKLWVTSLKRTNLHLILGLNFLLNPGRALLLTPDYAVFMSTPAISPILSDYPLEFRASERGGSLPP